MTATVKLDELGRFVVPKRMRDALHLRPGDKLEIEVRDDAVVLRPRAATRGLYREEGLWVYDSGSSLRAEDVRNWIVEERERRSRTLDRTVSGA